MKTLLLCLPLLFASCASDSIGLVGTAEFSGEGKVWSDGNVTVVIGEGSASMGIYGKATGIAFILPVPSEVEAGMVFAKNLGTGEEVYQEMALPLPFWAKTVFLPGEAEAFGLSFLSPDSGSDSPDQDALTPIEPALDPVK